MITFIREHLSTFIAIVVMFFVFGILRRSKNKKQNKWQTIYGQDSKAYTKYVPKIGTLRSDKPPKFIRGILRFGEFLFGFLSLLCVVGAIVFGASHLGDLSFAQFSIPMALFFGGAYLFERKNRKALDTAYDAFLKEVEELRNKEKLEEEAKEAAFKQAHPYATEEEFYTAVEAAGIHDLDSAANIARLQLYARNHGIVKTQDELIHDYSLGKEAVEAARKNARAAALSIEEAELESKSTMYADLIGQEKMIRMCNDMCREYEKIIWQCEQDEASVRRGGEATYLLGKRKEQSWATHGGIASGLAGPAAGLATAIDVQRKNEAVRQQNANLANAAAELVVFNLERIWKRKHEAEDHLETWRKRGEAAKMLLTEFPDENLLLSMINPTVKSIQQTETGAVRMKLALNAAPDLMIYGNVPAIVDGSIQVLLNVGGETVGTALCVADFSGIRWNCTVECICTNVSVQAENYDISFAPYHLWAVEKH